MDAQKYGYLTVGGTVCTCIRFCTQTDMFPLPPLKFGTAIEGRQGKLVQKMKAHASESGQMHAQHIAICGQVTKKKNMHCVSAQMYLRATVQDGVSGLDKQLQNFLFSMLKYGLSFPLSRWRFRGTQDN